MLFLSLRGASIWFIMMVFLTDRRGAEIADSEYGSDIRLGWTSWR